MKSMEIICGFQWNSAQKEDQMIQQTWHMGRKNAFESLLQYDLEQLQLARQQTDEQLEEQK